MGGKFHQLRQGKGNLRESYGIVKEQNYVSEELDIGPFPPDVSHSFPPE